MQVLAYWGRHEKSRRLTMLAQDRPAARNHLFSIVYSIMVRTSADSIGGEDYVSNYASRTYGDCDTVSMLVPDKMPNNKASDDQPTGCTKWLGFGCIVPVLVIGVLIIAGVAWNAITGGPEKMYMRGEIDLRNPNQYVARSGTSCSGVGIYSELQERAHVSVNPSSGEVVDLEIKDGFLDTSNICVLFFTGEVSIADKYDIKAPGMESQRFMYNLIDTVDGSGETILSPRIYAGSP